MILELIRDSKDNNYFYGTIDIPGYKRIHTIERIEFSLPEEEYNIRLVKGEDKNKIEVLYNNEMNRAFIEDYSCKNCGPGTIKIGKNLHNDRLYGDIEDYVYRRLHKFLSEEEVKLRIINAYIYIFKEWKD